MKAAVGWRISLLLSDILSSPPSVLESLRDNDSCRRVFAGVTPFLGFGAGGRTYNYRDLDVESTTNFAGYGALGVDIDAGPLSVRLEGRAYVSRFQPLTGGGDPKTRNDVALFAGLGLHF